MDTELQAMHRAYLLGWLVNTIAQWVMIGTVVALIVGGFAWNAGSTGWVVASPGLGLLVCAVGLWVAGPPKVSG